MSTQPDPLAAYLAGTPCPEWCEHLAPHGYDHDPYADPGRRWQRVHSRALHTETRWPFALEVQQLDEATAPDQPPTRYRAEYLLTFPSATLEVASADELRAVARLLDDLADRLTVDPYGTGAPR